MNGLFEKNKKNLRISHNRLDDAIKDDINAALSDLERVGVLPFKYMDGAVVEDEDGYKVLKDELIRKAIEFYLKWQYDYMGQADKWEKAYEKLRDALSLSEEYTNEE